MSNSSPTSPGPSVSVPTLYQKPVSKLLLNDNKIPVFMPIVCDYLMNFSGTRGIFRLCGNHMMVQQLGIIFNLPECAVPPCASVHDVSSFLKQWLRDLPEPLIPPNILNDFYNPDDQDSVYTTLKQLPEVNRKCLASIFAVLVLVLDQQNINQMGPANIATCFVGSLTQNSKDLTRHWPFLAFFNKSIEFLNDDGDDFILE
ncbi:RhoGAP domain containing protein [Tritrichomonas foetus]|uniref:RhoGAP domain containing protein n=1 Tax=Tritrichomonas foetus TaxID=1144522 RepID=A0A1J4JCY2_9EUKA|nr:RhoGAP domain containing protein [Tritrichomonas foetus]|eukprot:OHS95269.1 RhoGAP domain containing protein [Tritrichomonas foetus]